MEKIEDVGLTNTNHTLASTKRLCGCEGQGNNPGGQSHDRYTIFTVKHINDIDDGRRKWEWLKKTGDARLTTEHALVSNMSFCGGAGQGVKDTHVRLSTNLKTPKKKKRKTNKKMMTDNVTNVE